MEMFMNEISKYPAIAIVCMVVFLWGLLNKLVIKPAIKLVSITGAGILAYMLLSMYK